MPQSSQARRPEQKIGPYPGGIGVAIWLNTIDTDQGQRQVRSITLNPRRYRDSKTGEWKDAASYNPGDLPALLHAMQKALDYCFAHPLSGQEQEHDEVAY